MPLTPLNVEEALKNATASWVRLLPRCRDSALARGIEARTADPLWMLARQWQLGEFQGEDAGSPISVEVTHRTARLDGVERGNQWTSLRDADRPAPAPPGRSRPVEVFAEREAMGWDWRKRIRVGQFFERLVRQILGSQATAIISAYRQVAGVRLPTDEALLKLDHATQRFVRLFEGRLTDGLWLWSFISTGAAPQGVFAAPIRPIYEHTRAWTESLYGRDPGDPSAWRPQALDSSFRVRAQEGAGATILRAPSYRSGDFDWHECTVEQLPSSIAPVASTQRFAPTLVRFSGMPRARWWAFEDARTNFGALDLARTDLAKLILMEFAFVHGNDWFLVPLTLPVGSVTRIEGVRVTDVFGQVTQVSRAQTPGQWNLFTMSRTDRAAGASDLLFVPPAVTALREESQPMEEVVFVRDEGANMAWAIERVVRNGRGDPVRGLDAQRERRARRRAAQAGGAGGGGAGSGAQGAPGAQLNYRLATSVPPGWVPFLPVRLDPHRTAITLKRGVVPSGPQATAEEGPMSLVLAARSGAVTQLDEEVIPRAGIRVVVTRQRARWVNGETFVWEGRKVMVGNGERRSGLRFDVVERS